MPSRWNFSINGDEDGGSLVPLSDLFLGRTDNLNIRFAAAVALLFNVLMVIIAIIAIAMDDRAKRF